MIIRFSLFTLSLSALLFMTALPAHAHGIIGNRDFPATLAIEDPSVSDEVTLPQVSRVKEDGHWQTEYEVELDKRLTQNFALSIGDSYTDPEDDAAGWNNLEVGGKYQFFENAEHEIMMSLGAEWEAGGTGSDHGDSDSFSTITPTFYFGKGFGDISSNPMSLLRPFAVTGQIGYAMPTGGDTDEDPNTLEWGFSLQYSLPYLQEHVEDVGLPNVLAHTVPIVEFSMETSAEGDHSGETSGTINPGFIWSEGPHQFALEASIPVGEDAGEGVGFLAQYHIYLDDLLPNTLGKPIW